MKTASQWLEILIGCGVKASTAVRWADSFSVEVVESAFSKGKDEIDDWLAHVLHESAKLEQLEENLNYKAEALVTLFGRHRISEENAFKYGRTATQKANQPMVANCIYGGVWGFENLGNTEPGDGWKYRGRSCLQITGRSNYRLAGQVIGVDLISDPDLLLHPKNALLASILWWEKKISDSIIGNVRLTTKAVNGGLLGIEEREMLMAKLHSAFA
jgi:putative chitinase